MSTLLKREMRTQMGSLALLVFLAGCSANPHTITGNPRGGTGGAPESGVGQQSRSEEPGAEAETPGEGTLVQSGTNGVDGANGSAGEEGLSGVVGVTETIGTSAGTDGLPGQGGLGGNGGNGGSSLNGQDGVNGLPGQDGGVVAPAQVGAGESSSEVSVSESQTIELERLRGEPGARGADGRDGCGIVTFNQDFHARRLRAEELRLVELDLPYQSTRRHRIRTYQIGNPQTMVCGLPTMTNGQMVFAVDLTLPNHSAFHALREADLYISVTKIVRGRGERNFLSTELLCLLNDVRKCSGEAMTARNWLENRRASFFSGGDPVLSDLFSRAIVESPVERSCGGRRVYAAYNVNVDLQEALPGVDFVQEIYGSRREDTTAPYVNNTLYFVVADDTFVSEAKLNVQFQYDSCRVNDLNAAQAGSQ